MIDNVVSGLTAMRWALPVRTPQDQATGKRHEKDALIDSREVAQDAAAVKPRAELERLHPQVLRLAEDEGRAIVAGERAGGISRT